MNPVRKSVATVAAAGVLLGGGMAMPAYAAQQDGLINVVVIDDNNEILSNNNVAIGVAAQIAANVCGVKVGPLAVLGRAVDRSGQTDVICEATPEQDGVVFNQNQ
ncbi:hypothetical protein [Kocuria aegyptia]|uniref:Uncharacterized protein n=1 Tax=Kocuria aegyptia TaxID=330943 RepID=A0ABN2KKJ2_9MICC